MRNKRIIAGIILAFMAMTALISILPNFMTSSFEDLLNSPEKAEIIYSAKFKQCMKTTEYFNKIGGNNLSSTKESLLYLKKIAPDHKIDFKESKNEVILTASYIPFYFYKSENDCLKEVPKLEIEYKKSLIDRINENIK